MKKITFIIFIITITNLLYSNSQRKNLNDLINNIDNMTQTIINSNDQDFINTINNLSIFEKLIISLIGRIGNDNSILIKDKIERELIELLFIKKDYIVAIYKIQRWKAENPEKINDVDFLIETLNIYFEKSLDKTIYYSQLKEKYNKDIETEIINISLNILNDLYPDKKKVFKDSKIISSVRPLINYYQNATLLKKDKIVLMIKKSSFPEKYIKILSFFNSNFADQIYKEINNK